MPPRVRFAPSPTGYLHIGNARTALFNYLFARRAGGSFILRVEDTDAERSRGEYETALIEDLRWMGLDWDEGPDVGGERGPYRQTERRAAYDEYARKLLADGRAYRCYCTREELEAANEGAREAGRSVGYDNRCRTLTREQTAAFEREGRTPVLRFRVPDGRRIVVDDMIRGEVSFESETLSDFVIVKPDGMPVFHFAVVLDDALMEITHVIRGEDHLSNTPKHILLFEAVGAPIPRFAHMSMTLGPDRTRLSKRHGATSVRAYRDEGYLPEAFFNYIALLGWGSAENQEIFTAEELIREFSIERCNKSAAVFDPNKLLWMNGLYLRKMGIPDLRDRALPVLRSRGMVGNAPDAGTLATVERALALEREKLKTLLDVPDRLDFFLREPDYDPAAVEKHLGADGRRTLALLLPALEGVAAFTAAALEETVRGFCASNDLKPGAVFHPLRVAVSGKTKGPGLFEMLEVLGRESSVRRIRASIGPESPSAA